MKKVLLLTLITSLFACTPSEDANPDLMIDNVKSDPKPKVIYEDPDEIDPGDG